VAVAAEVLVVEAVAEVVDLVVGEVVDGVENNLVPIAMGIKN
jgi:hypothetical protein